MDIKYIKISLNLVGWKYQVINGEYIWCLINNTYGTLIYTSYGVREHIHEEEY